jgi:hypothetical protein
MRRALVAGGPLVSGRRVSMFEILRLEAVLLLP